MRRLWSGAPSPHQTSPLSPSARFISSTRWRALGSRSGSHLELRTCWRADPSCRTSSSRSRSDSAGLLIRQSLPPVTKYRPSGVTGCPFRVSIWCRSRSGDNPLIPVASLPFRQAEIVIVIEAYASAPPIYKEARRECRAPYEQVRPFGRFLFLHQGATRLLRAGRMAYRFSHIELGFPKLTCEAGVQLMAHIGFRSTNSRLNRTCGSKAETHGQKNPPG